MNTLIQLIESVKQSFSTTVDSFIEFINKRSKGAVKIAEMTEKKGGLSLLTAIHYKAKAIPYSKLFLRLIYSLYYCFFIRIKIHLICMGR